MRSLITALLLFVSLSAFAQPAQPARLDGNTLEGRPFSLETLRGKVVMLFFWNTDCVPCLQKMPELRANAAGWRGKPPDACYYGRPGAQFSSWPRSAPAGNSALCTLT